MSVHGQGLHAADDREYRRAITDLTYLANEGALAGVAEVIRERRRQIEEEGYTPQHDSEHHPDGFLISEADSRTAAAIVQTAEGIIGPHETGVLMAQAGALAAAEIDRLETL